MPQTILVVDDEPMIRTWVRTVLTKSGYHILEANNAEEALMLLSQPACTISLLLTDIVMPEMSGPELATKVLELRPDMPIVFISAFCDHMPNALRKFSCLAKPFSLQDLVNTVRSALGEEEERLKFTVIKSQSGRFREA